MTDDSQKLFEKMVKRGQKIEKETKELITEANKRIANQSLDLENISSQLNDGLQDIRKKFSDTLGLPQPVSRADFERLEKKVNALSRKISALEKANSQVKNKPSRRTPATRASSKKSTS